MSDYFGTLYIKNLDVVDEKIRKTKFLVAQNIRTLKCQKRKHIKLLLTLFDMDAKSLSTSSHFIPIALLLSWSRKPW